jgi:hypothetical protein
MPNLDAIASPARRRASVTVVALSALSGLAWALPLVVDGDPAIRLRDAEKLLARKGQAVEAIERLRELRREFPLSPEAERARQLLARRGYGMGFRLVFLEARALHRLGFQEADLTEMVERLIENVEAFFVQTYGPASAAAASEIEIAVLDSRARFRGLYPGLSSRSASGPMPPEGGGKAAARIAVYYDSRIVNRQDQLDLLMKGIVREYAVQLLLRHARRPLPASFGNGLCDYLATRLFPRKLIAVHQSPEELLEGFARAGLGRVQDLDGFRSHIASENPDGSVGALLYWQWVGLSCALFDCLIDGDWQAEADASLRHRVLRIAKLQAWLRDYDKRAADRKAPGKKDESDLETLEKLLGQHFGLDFEKLHRGLLGHVKKYAPLAPDFEGLTD